MPMDSFPTTYTLTVEPTNGTTYQHPWHLGTDEKLARSIAEDTFRCRNAAGATRIEAGKPDVDSLQRDVSYSTRTVALWFGRGIVDVFDGQWSSNRSWED